MTSSSAVVASVLALLAAVAAIAGGAPGSIVSAYPLRQLRHVQEGHRNDGSNDRYSPRTDGFPRRAPLSLDGETDLQADEVCGLDCRGMLLERLALKLTHIPSSWKPHPIRTEEELKAIPRFVTPILYGGLGNELFQLAAVHVYAKTFNIPVVVGYYYHWNRNLDGFDPWGGHGYPFNSNSITLRSVFPSMQWVTARNGAANLPGGKGDIPIFKNRVFNHYAFRIGAPDDYSAFPPAEEGAGMLPAFVQGYFFSHRYWHHERDYLLELFRFHPSIDSYIHRVYGGVLRRPGEQGEPLAPHMETVSIHLRLGHSAEPAHALLAERALPHESFFHRALLHDYGNPKRGKFFLIFSDSAAKAREMLAAFKESNPAHFAAPSPLTDRDEPSGSEGLRHQYLVVEENVIVSLAMMRLCTHHVLTASTLSFWGAYLDPLQLGQTIVPDVFFTDHGKDMVPPAFAKHHHWTTWDSNSKSQTELLKQSQMTF